MTMKPFCILSLILFMVSLFGNSRPKNDVIIFGHNYTGDLKDGKRHGIGSLHLKSDGSIYTGEWKNGLPDGIGTITFKDGKIQKGKFLDGVFIELVN